MNLEYMHQLARQIIKLAEAVLEEKDPRVCKGYMKAILGKITDFI